jgi:translation initiation factor IF-3
MNNKQIPFNNRKKKQHLTNDDIRCPKVRVIGEGTQGEVMSTEDAIELALSMDKDLILISENANPPVVKIEDYNKFLYNQEKLEKERKKNSSKVEIKEIQLSCTISDNDLNTKAKKAKEFLEDDNKVKCVIQLKGRQKGMPEQGELVMLKFADILLEFGSPEAMPKLESSKWLMMLKPKSKK